MEQKQSFSVPARFWALAAIFILSNAAGLAASYGNPGEDIAQRLAAAGRVLSLGYAAVLFTLLPAQRRYLSAGALQAAAAFILMSSASMTDVVEALGATLLSSLVTIPAEYFEYRAHSALLEGVNAKLSQLWRRLWRWYVIVLAASFVLALLLGTSQAGMSILLAAALAASVLLRLIKAALLLLSAKAAKRE